MEFLISLNFQLDADMIEMAGISDISDLTGSNVMNLVDLVLATDPGRFFPQSEKDKNSRSLYFRQFKENHF